MITLTTIVAPAKPRPEKTYRIRKEAEAAAVMAIGPHARPGFEFEAFRCDKAWRWRAFDDASPNADAMGTPMAKINDMGNIVPATPTRRITGFEAKASGGKHALAAINAAWRPRTVKVVLELPEDQAFALASLCKSLAFEDVQRLTAGPRDHDRTDTAIRKLRDALKYSGVNPR